jgi:4-carboxymuconolactone decarboxylase
MTDTPSTTPTDDRVAKGRALAAKLLAGAPPARPLPEEFLRQTMANVFGDVWQGEELELEERSLITCTVLVALGRENEQRLHFRGARNLGIPRAKIEAVVNHVAYYAGWPVAVSAMRVLDEVWEEMDSQQNASGG